MKTNLVLAGLALSATVALADDPKGGQALMESQTTNAAAAKPQAKNPVVKTPPANQILGHPVQYGGYFTEMTKAYNKRAFFNLKTPIDPQKDFENLSFYPETDKVQGFILFSVKF